jgi:hypothetical protein
LEQLSQLLKDFSSADILLALMLMRGSDSKDKTHGAGGGSSALIGLLAGMALAGQVGQMAGNLQSAGHSGAPGATAGIAGGQINLQI